VRVDDDTAAWWRALAAREGISVGELVRRAVTTTYAAAGEPAPVGRKVHATPTARRRGGCERAAFHRSGVYCKTCGTTPA